MASEPSNCTSRGFLAQVYPVLLGIINRMTDDVPSDLYKNSV
jgi:hypothetical protein